ELIVTMTFGVVLLSIVLQGVTAEPLLRVLELIGGASKRARFDVKRAELLASHAALDALGRLEREHLAHGAVTRELRSEYERLSMEIEDDVTRLHAVRRHLLEVEKDAIAEAYVGVHQVGHREVDRLLDLRLVLLQEVHREVQ